MIENNLNKIFIYVGVEKEYLLSCTQPFFLHVRLLLTDVEKKGRTRAQQSWMDPEADSEPDIYKYFI